MAPPFRAYHIGSLIRPQSLLDARAALSRNPTDAATQEKLQQAQTAAVAAAAQAQLSRNITPITDGEYPRPFFVHGLFQTLGGFEARRTRLADMRPGDPTVASLEVMGLEAVPLSYAAGKIRRTKPVYLDAWLELRRCIPREKWKDAMVTMPTPTWMHLALPDGKAYDEGVYGGDEEYFADLVVAVREEIMALYDAGLRNLQIDDPKLTVFCHKPFVEASREAGTDLNKLLKLYSHVHKELVKDLPHDLNVGIHLCRGNFPKGGYTWTGTYEDIAERLFNDMPYKIFALEFDTDRAGGFEPLRFLPKDKAVVLGLVTTKYAEMEDLQVMKRRVYEAASVIAEAQERRREEVLRDNLAVSPQCGFSSVVAGEGVDMNMEVMWEKLELVNKLAKDIWG